MLFALSPIFAVEILRMEWINDRNGLSQNTVRCIMQDNKGFMWFGTINGLNRYNGKEFTVMLPQTGNVASLPDSRIRSLQEDSRGYIWIRTTTNVFCCYDPRLERFVDFDPANPQKNFTHAGLFSGGDVWLWGADGCCRVRHHEGGLRALRFGEAELGSQSVSFVYEDGLKRTWIGSRGGLFRLENDRAVRLSSEYFSGMHEASGCLYFISDKRIVSFDNRQQKFGEAIAYPGNAVIAFNMTTLLNDGLILIATKDDLIAFDSRSMRFIPSETLFNNESVRNATFYTDNKGNKWVHNISGSVWRHFPDNHFEKFSLIPADILTAIDAERYEIYHDSRNIIWITTYGNGLFALDQNNGQTYHYTTENSDLPTDYLLCITEDRLGEIWVGTEFSGISKISLNNYPVKVLYPASDERNPRKNAVRLIYEDSQGRFWIGTRTGYLHIYDSSFRKLKSHKISGGLPFAITEDSLGNIWLGTRGKGLLVFPPSGNAPVMSYQLHDIDRQNTSSNNVFDIIRDSKNRIWVATFGGGLHYADLSSKDITFRHINTRTVNQDMMRAIIRDSSGLIWIGTNEGVNVFDPDELIEQNDKYINFRFDLNNNSSINNNEIKAILEDSKGRIWFGTTGGGLNLLIREEPLERSSFKHYTAQNGLSNEVIQTILEDDMGYIWVSTEGGSGISKFDPQTERFENFSFSNNLQSGLFNEGSGWKKKDGELMFGSYSGILIFDPKRIKYDVSAPAIVITGLRINDIDVRPQEKHSPLSQSIALTNSIKLNYSQNSFNIEFAMLNFHSPDYNQYSYYLDGYEKTWNQATRHNIAAYRNLPQGTYFFKVKGSNSFGLWTEQETVLKITVVPPFWRSYYAFLVYALLIIAIVVFIFRTILQIHGLNMAVKIEKQFTEYKLRFFTNISHEFRTPLTIIRASIENLSEMKELPPAVTKQINHMAKSSSNLLRLIDQLLEFRKLQNNQVKLQLEQTEIVGFMNDIYQTFHELSEKKKIRFLFESNLPSRTILIDRDKIDKITYNLISNAMKHTPENGVIALRLDFSEPNDMFTFSVSDSGSGIPKEKENLLFVRFAQINYSSGGTGIGLHLSAELANVHKGKIDYTDSELGGACFSVSIPLSDSNYDKKDIAHNEPAILPANKSVVETSENDETDLPAQNNAFKDHKVLIIEDDDEIRDFIQTHLSASFTVFAAENGEEGLLKAGNEQPNLIICDVMMPGIDGFEVTKRLKEDFQTSHIPVILLTAHSSDEHRLEGIEAGADAYITKPFSMKYLVARIFKLIEQREKLQQRFAREPGIPRHLIRFADKDKEFMDKIHLLIEQNMDNCDFSVDTFASTAGMGRTVFYKKVKGITGHPPNEYLRIIRMKKAAELLATTNLNVSEVSYKVGINDPFYFSKCFKAQFGKSPSQFQKMK
ncbi:MAG: response regulator [Tannerellaceae bacterium]|nr:response regulator [Tannerellaceae bacterium]